MSIRVEPPAMSSTPDRPPLSRTGRMSVRARTEERVPHADRGRDCTRRRPPSVRAAGGRGPAAADSCRGRRSPQRSCRHAIESCAEATLPFLVPRSSLDSDHAHGAGRLGGKSIESPAHATARPPFATDPRPRRRMRRPRRGRRPGRGCRQAQPARAHHRNHAVPGDPSPHHRLDAGQELRPRPRPPAR